MKRLFSCIISAIFQKERLHKPSDAPNRALTSDAKHHDVGVHRRPQLLNTKEMKDFIRLVNCKIDLGEAIDYNEASRMVSHNIPLELAVDDLHRRQNRLERSIYLLVS